MADPLKNGDTEHSVVVRDLFHYFGEGETRKRTLDNINIKLMPGEMAVMSGPSGGGKTTLLTLIGGIRTVQQGSVVVRGRELFGLSNIELMRHRQEIGFIFQAHNLFEALTATQNVRMALELRPSGAREMNQKARAILERLGLGERLDYKPKSLSGGQKQRVAIARALVNRPKVILADEPTAALDKDSGAEVVKLLKELAQEERCTILLVTHDQRILDKADRIVNLIDGRIASQILVEETIRIIEFLKECTVFDKETPAQLTEVSQKMKKEHYTPGSVIIHEGDEGDKYYLLREGEVEVRRKGDNGETLVAALGPGEFFGEAALLTGKPRNASVTAKKDSVMYSLKKGDFLAALNASASFKEQLIGVFSQRQ
jgi:putative ABC transport system ATP-binding protein